MKEKLMAAAEMIDYFRVVPRIIVGIYGYMMYDSWIWIKSIEDPTMVHVGILGSILGAAAAIFAFYSKSSRDWKQ